ncbi:30S ribosomal protein S21 [Pontibacter harenae]|uniref:30S ribosomal protein S21 n=1 Tax=Pontibacter harenae TaxID=2894083 RepID=UPI001E472D72|nr:30S ribosomal protein S21 [Pontibacter harenae]MCC9168176.1 30S ribosomal protein S21 [Pontibacter harenae]
MIIVNVKDNESVDRALKRFKKKFERTGVLKELRSRTFFEKPSVSKRKQKERAKYKQQLFAQQNY